MTRLQIVLISLFASICIPYKANAQVAAKTNLLYDALLSPNLGIEFPVAPRWSMEISGNYNGWKLSHGRQWKHWLVQPEARYWLDKTFSGHFFGMHAFGGQFNTTLHNARRQGWAAGLGAGYGYTWRFGANWGLSAELAVGYARYSYDKYPCRQCGRKIASRNKNYFGPTKAAVNLVYYFGHDKKPVAPVIEMPQEIIEIIVPEKEVIDTVPTFNFALVDVPHSRVLSQNISGVARVKFAVNKTDINPDLGDNAAELSSIISKLDSIRKDLNMTVVAVKFTGYASPEGRYDSNDRLASGRTSALKNHILQTRHLPDSIITLSHVAEDWAGLRAAVAGSNLPDKDQLLTIIDSGRTPDNKEAALRKHRNSWAWIAAEVLPSLRRTEYFIECEHRYEEKETKTLEEVNKAITAGDIDTASRLLVDIPSSPEADYARGVVAALMQRYDEAEAWFKRAQSRGITVAADALNQLSMKRTDK